jgi:Uma2 family endonuclease
MSYPYKTKESRLNAIQINHFPIQIIANHMGEDEFFDFCQENDLFLIEREANGTITINEPLGGEDGIYEAEVNGVLSNWAKNNTENILKGFELDLSLFVLLE